MPTTIDSWDGTYTNSRRRLSPMNQSSLLCNFKFSKRGQLLFFKTSNSSKIYPFTLRKPSKKKKYCKPQYNFGKKCGILPKLYHWVIIYSF